MDLKLLDTLPMTALNKILTREVSNLQEKKSK